MAGGTKNPAKGALHPKLAALKNLDINHFLARLNKSVLLLPRFCFHC